MKKKLNIKNIITIIVNKKKIKYKILNIKHKN